MTTPNETGAELEGLVDKILRGAGLVEGEDYRRQFRPGNCDIFGRFYTVDFYLFALETHPGGVFVEVKSQTSSGSADLKITHLVENILSTYAKPTAIVLDGEGLNNAREWAAGVAAGERNDGGHLVGVMNLSEFRQWARNISVLGIQAKLF